MNKTLILYALRDPKLDEIFVNNLKFFIKNGGIIDSPDIDYIIIVNSKEKPNIDLPKKVKILLKPNFGHGWGGWKEGLDTVNIKDYKYFCFMKDLLIGPFFKKRKKNWINEFKNLINEKTKLVSHSLNIGINKKKRLQAWVFASFMFFDINILNLMFEKGFFNKEFKCKKRDKKLCQVLINNNYNFTSLNLPLKIDFEEMKNVSIAGENIEILKMIKDNFDNNHYNKIFIQVKNKKDYNKIKNLLI